MQFFRRHDNRNADFVQIEKSDTVRSIIKVCTIYSYTWPPSMTKWIWLWSGMKDSFEYLAERKVRAASETR